MSPSRAFYAVSPAAAAIASGVRPSSRSCRCFSVNGCCTAGQIGSSVHGAPPAGVSRSSSRPPTIVAVLREQLIGVAARCPRCPAAGSRRGRAGTARRRRAIPAAACRPRARGRAPAAGRAVAALDHLAQRHAELEELAQGRRQVERRAVDAELVEVGRDHVRLPAGRHHRLGGLERERAGAVADVHHDPRVPGPLRRRRGAGRRRRRSSSRGP